MSTYFLSQSLLLFLLVCVDFTYSKVLYIRPSLDGPYPQNVSSCLTLSEFAANSSHNEVDIFLLFLPGNHTLDRKLLLVHGHNFSMSKYIQDNETVFVECDSQLGRFDISETISVSIKGLNFIRCGSNKVSQVTWLTIADSTFQSIEDNSTVLVISKVATAYFVRSQFLYNRCTFEHFDSNTSASMVSFDEQLHYIYKQPNISTGVLNVAFSNISIVSCRFMHNEADIGGALVAHNSCVHIDRCVYSYNTASFGGAINNSNFTSNNAFGGGVIYSSGNSSFAISNCNFASNVVFGNGVIYTSDNSLFTVSNCNFTSNVAFGDGVIYTSGNSSFNISNCNFASNEARSELFSDSLFIISVGVPVTISNTNVASNSGGVIYTSGDSSFTITSCNFTSNCASYGGVVATSGDSSFNITSCNFSFNHASIGGVVATSGDSSFNITSCKFTSNGAFIGGVVATSGRDSLFNITSCNFTSNSAYSGGVMETSDDSSFNITSCNFTSNSAYHGGVVITTSGDSSFTISNSNFTSNNAEYGGVVITTSGDSSFIISNSKFTSNSASYYGGVMYIFSGKSSFTISNSTFTYNSATLYGGVLEGGKSSFTISNSNFTSNSARYGGVMYTSGDSTIIQNNVFLNNNATSIGGVIHFTGRTLNICNSTFSSNAINTLGGGIIFISQCSMNIANSAFNDNVGSIYTFNSILTFSGNSKFENSAELLIAGNESTSQKGGVITSFQSTVIFTTESNTNFSNNRAMDGGAISAIESTIMMYGETIIANNNLTTIANSSGGGISLKQSRLEIKGRCHIVNNSAVSGGGIHATSSTIAVYQPGILQIVNNCAELGGGLYLEINSKLYILKTTEMYKDMYLTALASLYLHFTSNHANYGGAVYVADDTNSGTCSNVNECFIQTLALYQLLHRIDHVLVFYPPLNTMNILFSENSASVEGSNMFGGLLDRCIPSPFAEVYQKRRTYYSGATYLQNISITTHSYYSASISSQPVRVCFCNSEHEPDCSYQFPTITIKKGEAFNVSVVAVDQINNTVDANIITTISSSEGGFSEGQQTQSVGRNCTDLTYNVFSPHDSETINLFADGPCGSAALSTSHVTIQFTDCTCPVGFQPLYNSKSSTRCECVCDSQLSPFITDCDDATNSVFRIHTNSWITYINDTDPPNYVKHPNCPFDYCQLLTENISINFNLPNGADKQCAYNRTGLLCGSCRENSSLSLASSRCLPCHSYWPAECVVILLAAILAGILLVTALLALNMTVSIGLINGFIFYANIVSAGSAVFFPSSELSFLSVFVAWLNLDIGIDVCFMDGLDAYIKTWLQLAFPLYIISLVLIVIIVSEYSPRFSGLIGRKDPVSTLATLILISYAKLLSVTITALSFATLNYPDGNQEIVWLPDGNVKYFQGKHIPLVLVAVLIILIGLPYTILLFLWQWIVRAPKWKIFNWTRNTKLNAFIAIYHVPHNSKYRYWTGLLLLVRVVFYITASVTVSTNPQTLPLIAGILLEGLFLIRGLCAFRVYKNLLVDVVDTVLYFNLLALSLFSLYDFKVNQTKQTAVAYISTITTFFLFIGSIFYHVRLLIKKTKPPQDLNKYSLAPLQPANVEVTHSVVEPPKRDEYPPSDRDRDKPEITTPP